MQLLRDTVFVCGLGIMLTISGTSSAEELATEEKLREAYELYRAGETVTLERNEWLFGLGASYRINEQALPGFLYSDRGLSAQASLAYGFGNGLEVSAALPVTFTTRSVETSDFTLLNERSVGLGNATLGAANALPLSLPFSATLLGSVSLPTGSDKHEDQGFATSLGVSVDKIMQPAFVYGSLSAVRDWEADRNALNYSAGFGFYLNYALSAGMELSGSYSFDPPQGTGNDTLILTAKLSYQATPRFGISPSVSFGLTDSAPDVIFGANLWWRF